GKKTLDRKSPKKPHCLLCAIKSQNRIKPYGKLIVTTSHYCYARYLSNCVKKCICYEHQAQSFVRGNSLVKLTTVVGLACLCEFSLVGQMRLSDDTLGHAVSCPTFYQCSSLALFAAASLAASTTVKSEKQPRSRGDIQGDDSISCVPRGKKPPLEVASSLTDESRLA
ncbi:hypothetical protein BaRGS_00008250, partial [Batillaria attramentaria]